MDQVTQPPAAAGPNRDHRDGSEYNATKAYFTYRPLSNLPTPPPSYKEDPRPSAAAAGDPEHGEPLMAKFRGPAIHLVNLVPSSASLTAASVPVVQGMLSRADLPIETVALAVCILDSLDKKFARVWRVSCPLLPGSPVAAAAASSSPALSSSKRHSLPLTPQLYQQRQHQMLHIDSVPPEIIILAALVIAVKFVEDPQQVTEYYCSVWGRGTWSHEQLNVTERCIMNSLDYRIMPLCDEDCLADAMVDMQLAGRQASWESRELSPPDSLGSSDSLEESEGNFVLGHGRSRTMTTSGRAVGLGLLLTPMDSPCLAAPRGDEPTG